MRRVPARCHQPPPRLAPHPTTPARVRTETAPRPPPAGTPPLPPWGALRSHMPPPAARTPALGRPCPHRARSASAARSPAGSALGRSEEHTSELQSLAYLVCRLLLEKKKK